MNKLRDTLKEITKVHVFFIVVWLIGISGLISYDLIYEAPIVAEHARQNIIRWDTSEISGQIKYVKQEAFNGDAFVMSNEPEKLYFASIVFTGAYKGEDLRWMAKSGDTIIKHPYSDTLLLITKKGTYTCLAYPGNESDRLRLRKSVNPHIR